MGNRIRRAAAWFGWTSEPTQQRDATPDDYQPRGIPLPPARSATTEQALSLTAVYRAVQVLATAARQLSLDARRAGVPIPNSLVTKPDVQTTSRGAWIERTVTSLALHGEAFWLKLRGPDQSVISLPVIDPRLVQVWQDHPTGQRRYGFDGRDVTADIQHLELLRVPGTVHGLGPIQAARLDVAGAIDVRNYAAEWFTRGDIPNGILSTGSVLADGMAKKYKQRWEETADHGVRVLEAGLKYEPLLLKPADAQWIESQNFSTLQIARLFGVSTSLMMIAPEGGSQTYQNVEQDWIALVRFTLMKYLSEIEDALTECVPRGQKVKFNIDALLRTDTKTRYEAHQMGLAGGWLTVPEIRAMEGLPPLSQTPSTPTPKEAPHGAENPA